MSLEEIRLDYENESGFTSAKILRPYLTLSDKDWAIISERYAQQRVNEVLDKAIDAIDNMELECYNNCAGQASDAVENLKLKNNEK